LLQELPDTRTHNDMVISQQNPNGLLGWIVCHAVII
jgi:hypothetical protein